MTKIIVIPPAPENSVYAKRIKKEKIREQEENNRKQEELHTELWKMLEALIDLDDEAREKFYREEERYPQNLREILSKS